MNDAIDLGDGVIGRWTRWAPDRDLNPQYSDLPDIERYGLILEHKMADRSPHEGVITFDSEVARPVFPNHPRWQVQSWEPLTITPSVLCSCGWHGFITDGKWRSLLTRAEAGADASSLPGGDRTPNPQLRRLVLYPVELRAEIRQTVGIRQFP